MLDGSPELTALTLRLHEWYGQAVFTRGALAAVVLTVAHPHSARISAESYVGEYIAALVRDGYVEPVENGFVLGGRSREYAAECDERIEEEVEILGGNLSALFSLPEPQQSSVEIRDDADIHAVTRCFLVDVLQGAELPPELLEEILATFERNGRLTMSPDGRRYRIVLVERERKSS